jgi:hypothetical protein
MATDTSTLNYIVTDFDQQHLVLMVSFPSDGTTANIGVSTVPTTQEQLDALVKPYATHLEVANAISGSTPIDTTFIKSKVGKTNKTTRYSQAKAAATSAADGAAVVAAASAVTTSTATLPTNEIVITSGTVTAEQKAANAKNHKAADLVYIKELIAEALAAQAAAASTVTTAAS